MVGISSVLERKRHGQMVKYDISQHAKGFSLFGQMSSRLSVEYP